VLKANNAPPPSMARFDRHRVVSRIRESNPLPLCHYPLERNLFNSSGRQFDARLTECMTNWCSGGSSQN